MIVVKVTSFLFSAAICIAQFIHAKEINDVNFDGCVPSKNIRRNYRGKTLTKSITNVEPIQEFIYKCGDEVEDEFWVAPNRFHILYGSNKLDFFRNSTFGFNFTLKQRTLDCEETFFIRTSIPDNKYESGPNLTALLFSPAGYLVYNFDNNVVQDEIYYQKNQYCVQNITDDALTVRLCKSTCFHLPEEKGSEKCIPKCCPFGWILDSETEECQEVKEDWVPSVYVNRLASKPFGHWEVVMKYAPPIEINCYNDSREIAVFPINDFRFIANGQLVRRVPINRGSKIRWTQHISAGGQPFCIDAYWNTSNNFQHFTPSEAYIIVTRCTLSETSEQEQRILEAEIEAYKLRSQLIVPIIFLPCAFTYIAILIVYITLWEKQDSQGWTVMALCTSQLVLYLVLMTLMSMPVYSNVFFSSSMHYVCNALGIISNFAFVSTYSWTAVLTFDVWGKLSSVKQVSKTSKGRKRFLFYSCFAIGVPTLIVSVGSVMEWGFWEFPEDTVVMPGYSDSCSVGANEAFLLYQRLPSALLFLGNVIFLAYSFCSVWEATKNSKVLKDKYSLQSNQSLFDNRVVVIAKLMVMMGAFLIFDFTLNFSGLSRSYTFLQAYRILHAIGLFYLFVCSEKAKKQIREKFPTLLKQLKCFNGE